MTDAARATGARLSIELCEARDRLSLLARVVGVHLAEGCPQEGAAEHSDVAVNVAGARFD
jgi:hypothetical protein